MWDLVGNPEDRFSHNEAHMVVNNKDADQTLLMHRQVYPSVVCIYKTLFLFLMASLISEFKDTFNLLILNITLFYTEWFTQTSL